MHRVCAGAGLVAVPGESDAFEDFDVTRVRIVFGTESRIHSNCSELHYYKQSSESILITPELVPCDLPSLKSKFMSKYIPNPEPSDFTS